MKQWLSVKQLFVAINILAKAKPTEPLHLSVFEILEYNFGIFDTTNAPASHKTERKSRCTSFEKFMLFLFQLPVTVIQRIGYQQYLPFSQVFQNIDFGSDKLHSIDNTILEEVLILDLHLRKKNEFPPKISIEKHLINLLQSYPQFADVTVQLLLDNTKFDKIKKSNPWKQLWNRGECWSIFQRLYETQFDKWDAFISKMQQFTFKRLQFLHFVQQQSSMYVYWCHINTHTHFFFTQMIKYVFFFCVNRWNNGDNIIEVIELFYDSNQMEGEGLIIMLKLLWTRIANNEKTNEKHILTSNILQLLLKKLKKIAYFGLNYWQIREEERDASQDVPFHSKVIELVSSDTFAKARLYHPRLKESVNERHDELSMNNKKWTLEEIGICATVNWELWPQIFNNINNIPKIGDLDEKKEEPVSDKLCSNLSYCFECRLWFERENSMQMELSTFFSKVLTQLVTNDSLLSINIHKYLMQHQNEIKDISSHCSMDLKSSLQKLEEIVNEYQQFFELLRIFKSIHSDYLLEYDLSDRLKEFEQQSDSWEAQVFVNVKDNYKDEIQLLQSCEEKMKIILERSQSLQSLFFFFYLLEKKKKEEETLIIQFILCLIWMDVQGPSKWITQ
ncbi:hypothetical protein RFI_12380, partial [Reticulomyxa filosa]